MPPSKLQEEKEGTAKDPKEGAADTSPECRTLSAVVKEYQKDRDTLEKRNPASARREKTGLRLWRKRYGAQDMLELKNATLNEFAEWRKTEHEVSGRAIDLDVMALSHMLDLRGE